MSADEELALHECCHAVAWALSGASSVIVYPDPDGRHWCTTPRFDDGEAPHPDALWRAVMAGWLVDGYVSDSDRADLARIPAQARERLQAFCLDKVKPAVSRIPLATLRRIAQALNRGESVTLRARGLLH